MSVRSHHIGAAVIAGSVILSTVALLVTGIQPVRATCGPGASISIIDPGSSGSGPLTSIRTLKAYTSPTPAASSVTFMITGPIQKPLGNATQYSSGTVTDWRLNWDSRDVPNGPYQMIAISHFGNVTTYDCASPIIPFNVFNTATQAPTLVTAITPNNWDTFVGTSRTFTLDSLYTDQYGRVSHVGPNTTTGPTWQTNVGTLSTQSGPSTVLNAGPVIRVGTLVANVVYANLAAHAEAHINVKAPTSSSSGGTDSTGTTTTTQPETTAPGTDSTTDDTTRLAAMPTIFRPAEPTNSAPNVALATLSCFEKKIGQAAFQEIATGKRPPTIDERRLASSCFSGPEAIPAVLAPIAPARVSELNLAHELITVGEIKNATITNTEGDQVTGMLLSGKGAPSTSIFIYIFSDPLVLRAETDDQGKWSYVLETPLAPGKHEVYAVAEKDAGNFVRSAVVPVQIAAAAPGSTEGSLVIESTWSAAQIGFMGLAALLVLAAIGVIFTLRRRRKPSMSTAAPAEAPAAATAPPVPVAPPATPGIIMPTTAPNPQPAPPPTPPAEPPSNGPQA